jgi:hypothetical protein
MHIRNANDVTATNAIAVFFVATEWADLAVKALVPSFKKDPQALRLRVIRELAGQAKYAAHFVDDVPVQSSAGERQLYRLMGRVRAEAGESVVNKIEKRAVRLPSGVVDRIVDVYAGLTKAQIIEAHKRAMASLSFE